MKFKALLSIVAVSFYVLFSTQCSNSAMADDYIPEKAFKYFDTINQETDKYFAYTPSKAYVPALIEHESCISLTHRRCWEPTSRLKTSREEGAGLGQLTRTWNKDGTVRFDSLKGMANAYKEELKELRWENVYSRPDLQIRALILMIRDNYKALQVIEDPIARLQMADAAYNGGLGGVRKDRLLCGLKKGCDPQKWFGNVELTCSKSKAALYGTRSPCYINRHHVDDVFNYNLPKYELQFKAGDTQVISGHDTSSAIEQPSIKPTKPKLVYKSDFSMVRKDYDQRKSLEELWANDARCVLYDAASPCYLYSYNAQLNKFLANGNLVL